MIKFNQIYKTLMVIMEKTNTKNKNKPINQHKLKIIRLQMTNCRYKKSYRNLKLKQLSQNNEKITFFTNTFPIFHS